MDAWGSGGLMILICSLLFLSLLPSILIQTYAIRKASENRTSSSIAINDDGK
jgi:hypothetical protein